MMNEKEATEWVRTHEDDDELDETELRDAFTALYEREPDAQDEQEGLWSHCCAAVFSGAQTSPKIDWTYDTYWNYVIGDARTPSSTVEEFALSANKSSLDQWIGEAEAESWRVGGIGGHLPPEWADFHQRALNELLSAAEEEDDEDASD